MQTIANTIIFMLILVFAVTMMSAPNIMPVLVFQTDDALMMDTVRHTSYVGQSTSTNAPNNTIDEDYRLASQKVSRSEQIDINSIIEKALSECNLYNYVTATLVKSVIQQESDFRPDVVSVAGAKGIMQLMPDTFNYYAQQYDVFKTKDIFNIYENICAGIMYLNDCFKAWESHATNAEELTMLALASYNIGVTNLQYTYGVKNADELKKSNIFPARYAQEVLDHVR